VLTPSNSVPKPVETGMRALLGDGPVAAAGRYHLESGGSRTRARLALDAGKALGLIPDVAVCCAVAVELLHNASLVHDDLQEKDDMRRGQPALWRRFGHQAAICAGDLMISAAFASLALHPRPAQALGLMHQAVADTARGQADDLAAGSLSLYENRTLAMAKTGPLLALPVRLALLAADAPGDALATKVGHKLAVAYQALDDLHDHEADRAAGRTNLCMLFEAAGYAPQQAREMTRDEAGQSLKMARGLAVGLQHRTGSAFCNLADRLDSALTEISDAA